MLTSRAGLQVRLDQVARERNELGRKLAEMELDLSAYGISYEILAEQLEATARERDEFQRLWVDAKNVARGDTRR